MCMRQRKKVGRRQEIPRESWRYIMQIQLPWMAMPFMTRFQNQGHHFMLLQIGISLAHTMHLTRAMFGIAMIMHVKIISIGNVQLKFYNVFSFTLWNVRHVPKITKSLISTRKLDDVGSHSSFNDHAWKITKGSLDISYGSKCGTHYLLHVSNVKVT